MVLFTLISKGTEIVIDLTVFASRKLYGFLYSWIYPNSCSEIELLYRIEKELSEIKKRNSEMLETIEMVQIEIKKKEEKEKEEK